MVRTFSRTQWDEASAAWHEGGFDRETWHEVRKAAAQRGMLYPPTGSTHDDIDAAHPSQRAIVYRAIDNTPVLLMRIVGRSSSWSQVTSELIRSVTAARADAEIGELEDERRDEARRYADRSSAPQLLGEIMRRAAGGDGAS